MVRIERAQPHHIGLIKQMCRHLVEHLRSLNFDAPFVWDSHRLEDDLFGFRPVLEAFIAFDDGEPVGYTLATHGYDVETWRREYELLDLYVTPEARGKGVSKLLFDRAKTAAIGIGAHQLGGYIYKNNPGIQKFMERYGFTLSDNYIQVKMPL